MNSPQKERILVVVKTYPTLSQQYGETVCTAGVRPDGSWIRLYPIPFRRLGQSEQYSKFDWLDCNVVRHSRDSRPESFRPIDSAELIPVGHVGTDNKWRERRRILLEQTHVFDRMDDVIAGAKANTMSLCVFKPTLVTDFVVEKDDREWDTGKLESMRKIQAQLGLFDDNEWRKTFQVVQKVPYSFSYRFVDVGGRKSELKILDWEIGALYWNCLRSVDFSEKDAIAKVREKYLDDFRETNLHLFLGTTQAWHAVAPNPWVIVGVFPAPHDSQLPLSLTECA